MHASPAHADPACAKNGPIRSKAAERHHKRLHYRATVAQVCEQLVDANLTSTGYRVALDTLARMLRRGSTTEAVGNEWVASRLHVGRNAVSTAYSALEAFGFLRRVPVKHRGAPTRTRLISVSASLIDGNIPAGVVQAVVDSAPAPAPRPNLTVVAEQGRPAQPAPMDRVGPDSLDGATVAVNDGAPVVEPQVADASAEPGADVADVSSDPAPTTDPFVFNQAVYGSMCAKVPADERFKASRARSPKECPVNEDWNLTPDEIRHYLALIPKPEPLPKRAARDSISGEPILPITPTPELAAALAYAHPRLVALTGSNETAAKLGDQIAFQVCCGSLGGGDDMVGIRAGVSLVAKGRWTEPREFAWFRAKWSGITARAVMMASLGLQCHARKSVR